MSSAASSSWAWTSLGGSTTAEKVIFACAIACIVLAGVARWSQKSNGEKQQRTIERSQSSQKKRRKARNSPLTKVNGQRSAYPVKDEQPPEPRHPPSSEAVVDAPNEVEPPVLHVDPDNGNEWQTVPRRRKADKKRTPPANLQ